MMAVIGIDTQIGEQTVVRFEAEHVDGISTLFKEALVALLDNLLSELEKGLWI